MKTAFIGIGKVGFAHASNLFKKGHNVKPLMLIAGSGRYAKEKVPSLIEDIGFFPKDTGNPDQSLHPEHMTLLWVKMARMGSHHPNFVRAYLEKKSK